MIYRKITALALGLLLLISGGCSLVDYDEEKAAQIEDGKTIIEYNGAVVTKGEITSQMSQYLTANSSSIDAIKSSGDETWNGFKESYITEIATDLIAIDKAKELGLDQLTDEQQATVDESYNSAISSLDSIFSSTAQSAVDADSSLNYDTELKRLENDYMKTLGYDLDTYRDELVRQAILSSVKDYFIKDITVTEEEVRKNYDASVDIQKNNIELSPGNITMQAQFGGLVLYYPAGYMKVRHILIAFDEDTKSKALQAYSATGDNTEYDKIIAAALPAIQPTVDEVTAKIDAGEDFTALLDEYNTDSNMGLEPAHTEGQVVGPYSTDINTPGYLDAVAKLTAVGDYTTITTYSGCYIIHCERMLEGAVPYDEVKDTMKASMLSTNQASKWSEVTSGWIEEAKAAGTLKMYPDRY
jgi:peptidyl-prolyl cis-trans isomerase D